MKTSTERFSNRVENYVRYRPDYPAEIILQLMKAHHLDENSAIADIGSGTGIFSRRLLTQGLSVTAVEPNKEMREAAEGLLSHYERFRSIDGSAEQTNLSDASVDLIVSAQAFHWFHATETRREFNRILKPTGSVALVWNQRDMQSPFQIGYDAMLREHAPEYNDANHANLPDETIAELFDSNSYKILSFKNNQSFDLQGFLGRMQSSSYTPAKGAPGHDNLMALATGLFNQHEVNGRISFDYDTRLHSGKLNTQQ